MSYQYRTTVLLAATLLGGSSAVSGWTLDRRRLLVHHFSFGSLASILGAIGTAAPPARAACLPGDLSPSCIGVYKVPIDDSMNSMVETKEALKQFAPDLNYVPPVQSPKSTRAALDKIKAQRAAADDIRTVVASGRLEEAGIKVLNLIPTLSAAGRMLLEDAKRGGGGGADGRTVLQQLREQQLESMFLEAEVAWKSTDITIGQGLRGDLGVSAVAQLTILSDIRVASAALDDFISAMEQQLKN